MSLISVLRKQLPEPLKRIYRSWRPSRKPAQLDWLEKIRLMGLNQLPDLLQRAPKLAPAEKKRVLFWAMSPWSYITVDCLIATALRLRGHDALVIVCDGLGFCEAEQQGGPNRECNQCFRGILAYVNAFGLEWKPVSDFISEDVWAVARGLAHTQNVNALRTLVVDGIRVGELAQVNTGYYQGVPSTLWKLLDKQVFRSACEAGYVLTKAADRILDQIGPDVVVTVGGKTVIWAPIFELAEKRGLRAVNWEDWSVHPNGFVFSHQQPALIGFLHDIWPREKERALTESQRRELRDLFSAWKRSEATPYKYYESPLESPDAIRKQLELEQGKPIVAMFPNILREDNRMRGRTAFGNQMEWLSSVIRHAAEDSDTYYVIRIHPAECKLSASYIMNRMEDMLYRFVPSVPENVKLVPPESKISSYTLAEMADVIMVWTGTLGLEFALAGRRVLVVGEPGYRGKGFTVDICDESDMIAKIEESFGKRNITPTEIEYAERYAYILRFRTLVKLPFHTGHKDRKFILPSFSELAVGGHPVIEDLCDCILTGRPFLDIGVRPKKAVFHA